MDIITPLLNAMMDLVCLAKMVSSAFRTIGITGLPVTHDDMFAHWFKR
jgi:hypothetical protein